MLRKLMQDHQPQYIAASFDLPGRRSATTSPPTTKPTARRCRTSSPSRSRWCTRPAKRSACRFSPTTATRPTTSSARWRGGPSPSGFDVAIVTGDKDFFQLVRDGIRVFNPRDDGTWYDAAGVKEKFGVTPDQVVDVLALMGDTIDNVKGVPGIGEKGARDLIATYGSLDALLERAAEVPQKQYREACSRTPTRRGSSRELLRIRTDVPVAFDAEALRYRGGSRERCFELFTELGFRSLVMEYAPTAETIGKDYGSSHTRDGAARARRRAARGRALRASGVLPDAPSAMRAGIVGLAFSTVRRARALRAARERRHATICSADRPERRPRTPSTWTRRCAGGAQAASRRRGDREGRSRSEVRRDRPGAARRRRCGASTPTRCSPAICSTRRDRPSARGSGARAPRLQGADARRTSAAAAPRRSPLAQIPPDSAARLRGRARRPRAAARRSLGAAARKRTSSTAVYHDLERPLIPVLVAIERAGVRVDGPALAAQSQHVERELASRSAQIFELAGEEFNINSPKQLSEILFDKLQLPDAEAQRQDADGVHRRRGARGARARARPAAADPRVARAAEAERHLHRRAAAAGQSRRPAACTRASTRRWPRPAG